MEDANIHEAFTNQIVPVQYWIQHKNASDPKAEWYFYGDPFKYLAKAWSTMLYFWTKNAALDWRVVKQTSVFEPVVFDTPKDQMAGIVDQMPQTHISEHSSGELCIRDTGGSRLIRANQDPRNKTNTLAEWSQPLPDTSEAPVVRGK